MILLYGAGGEPGRGEIPMDPIRYRASDDFLFCIQVTSLQIFTPQNTVHIYILP